MDSEVRYRDRHRGRNRRPGRQPGRADARRGTRTRRSAGDRRSMNAELVAVAVAIIFIGIVLLLLFFAAIRIVNQYERLLIFTLGRTSPDEVKGPGWVFVVPIAQRGIKVDLREQFIEVPSQTGITKDNAP